MPGLPLSFLCSCRTSSLSQKFPLVVSRHLHDCNVSHVFTNSYDPALPLLYKPGECKPQGRHTFSQAEIFRRMLLCWALLPSAGYCQSCVQGWSWAKGEYSLPFCMRWAETLACCVQDLLQTFIKIISLSFCPNITFMGTWIHPSVNPSINTDVLKRNERNGTASWSLSPIFSCLHSTGAFILSLSPLSKIKKFKTNKNQKQK